ncbi:MAG: AAA family ATPase [Bacteroidetes bacterium]|nr:MAG: AAA family ATPase [Bacteroidota bacterium]
MTDDLKEKAKRLRLYHMVSRWSEYAQKPWVKPLLNEEEAERVRRNVEKRLKDAKVGEFKPMSEFDWAWPKRIDRELVEELFNLQFLEDCANVVLIGPNGIGKSMIAQNIAHAALMAGTAARFVKASDMLDELLAADEAYKRKACLKKYSQVDLLIIDEVGYLSYDSRYADLLYEVVNARYKQKSTIVTTNKEFQQWGTIFPNAACVVTLIDRLVHKAEIVAIQGDSYRKKEAQERKAQREKERNAKRRKKNDD